MIKNHSIDEICNFFNVEADYASVLGRWIFKNKNIELDIPREFITNDIRSTVKSESNSPILLSNIAHFFEGVMQKIDQNKYIISNDVAALDNNRYSVTGNYIVVKGCFEK